MSRTGAADWRNEAPSDHRSSHTRVDGRAVAADVCAMLNGKGGLIAVGVAADGKVVGVENAEKAVEAVQAAVAQITPVAPVGVYPVEEDAKTIVLLDVPRGPKPPYTFDGRMYTRAGAATRQATASDVVALVRRRGQYDLDWERQPSVAVGIDGLDLEEIRRTARPGVPSARTKETAADLLRELNVLIDGRPTQAAVVAFSVDPLPWYPQCALRLARFKGVTKTEFLDQRQLTGHAFKLLREANIFLQRHLPVAGRFEPGVMERKDEPLFPTLALREALVNALVHRDYSIPGGAVSVAIYDNRLEIISTGTLPFGLTVADLLKEHVSKPRNPLLADLFYRRGLIERWGRGIQKIIDLCVAAGHPEPQFEERAGDVVVRFIPSGYTPPHRVDHDLTDRQRRVLHFLSDGRRAAASAIRASIDPDLPERTLRDDLKLLREFDLIDTSGRGPGARWWLVRSEAE